jgi:hypothetical protein
LFYVYTKCIKNRKTKQIANHTRPESDGFDGYDDDFDITSHLGKRINNTYDVVEVEEEVPYTQSTAELDYLQIRNQTDNHYLCIPSSEPTYLEMACNAKPLPLPRRSLKKEFMKR